MARSSFVSFHYQSDHWRVQQVLNMGAIEGQTILPAQEWEKVLAQGAPAVEKWINEQMAYKGAVVVLIGAETASRPWVQFEIKKAWKIKKPLVGIHIHGLLGQDKKSSPKGVNPFKQFTFSDSDKTYADFVPVYDPSGTTSTDIYANIKANLESWVASGYKTP